MTAAQLDLLESPKDRAFREFDEAHPQVVAEVQRLARQAQDRGRRISAKTAIEFMRWLLPDGHPLLGIRINNDLTSRIARAAMDRDPSLVGFFTTRELRS